MVTDGFGESFRRKPVVVGLHPSFIVVKDDAKVEQSWIEEGLLQIFQLPGGGHLVALAEVFFETFVGFTNIRTFCLNQIWDLFFIVIQVKNVT
jgi:hypothetical protein